MKTAKCIIYDRTVRSPVLWLTWRLWAWFLLLTRRVSRVYGAASVSDAMSYLVHTYFLEAVEWQQVQFWCHGRPGQVLIGQTTLTKNCTADEWATLKDLSEVIPRDCMVWFRSCSTFAGPAGKEFANWIAATLACHVAGFTYTIWFFQSGLRCVGWVGQARFPNDVQIVPADWSALEGGTGVLSWPWKPRTISALQWWV